MFRQQRAGHAYHDPRGSAYTKTTVAVKTVKGNVSRDLYFNLCNIYHGARMAGTCPGLVEGDKKGIWFIVTVAADNMQGRGRVTRLPAR